MPLAEGIAKAANGMASSATNVFAVGTDVELISSVPTESATFIERNFTDAEVAYCKSASDFKASLAGRWSAKEAVFKSLKTTSRGGGAAMKDLEITSDNGVPGVKLHGEAAKVAQEQGIGAFELSISHAEGVAMAIAIAKKQ